MHLERSYFSLSSDDIEECAAACTAASKPFFAIQNGQNFKNCFCANNYQPNEDANARVTDEQCNSSPSQAYAAYKIIYLATIRHSDGYPIIGCYQDDPSRDLQGSSSPHTRKFSLSC